LRTSQLWIRVGGAAVAVAIVAAVATNATAGRAPAAPHGTAAYRPAVAAAGRSQGAGSGKQAVAAGQTAVAGGQAGPPAQAAALGSPAAPGSAASPGSAVAGSAAPGSAAPGSAAALARLSAVQLAGQRVIYSYRGHTPPASLLWRIRHGEAAGVIFFGQNISSRAQIKSVISELERANASQLNPVREPLLLMTDQEGGAVRRLPGAPALSEKQIGQAAHPAVTAKAEGTAAGRNLRGVGMNVNLAPVLDVYRAPGNFIDEFGRSYSNHAHTVSYLGADFIRAQQAAGVAATAKHFPGLGAAARSQNTDLGPVTLGQSLRSIRTVDEAPYPAAIAARVQLIMVSWARYPALDRHRPAGLSSAVVGGELRKRLGFRGVTITDALEAGALRAYGSTANRSLLAAGAGMDLLLCAEQQVAQGSAARNALQAAYLGGRLSQAAFQAAVQRIITLRTSLRS
jgi:beta-N-acetylhexosaminidase